MSHILVTRSTVEETVLHIFKQRMGLTRRGSSDDGGLTVTNVSVNQTKNFTVHETSEFVTLVIPTNQILKTKVGASTLLYFQTALTVVHLSQFTTCPYFPIRIHYSVKHLNQTCFTDLHRQQTTPAVILQGGCCDHLQGDISQNALDHGEHTAMHRWVFADEHSKTKVVINYWMIFWPLAIPRFLL